MQTKTSPMKSKKLNQLRSVVIERNFTKHPAGSVLIKQGDTWVLCTASVEETVHARYR